MALDPNAQGNPYVVPVTFGGQQGAERVQYPEAPQWMRQLAPPLAGPGTSVAVARQMAESGASGSDIFYHTGWFRGADGAWQWVLPDRDAKLNRSYFNVTPAQAEKVITPPTKNYKGYTSPARPETLAMLPGVSALLPSVLQHPTLYQAYPELSIATVSRMPPNEDGGTVIADYNRSKNAIRLSSGHSEQEIASVLLHELQHGVQGVEGFAAGGDKDYFLPSDYYSRHDTARQGIKQVRDEAAKVLGTNGAYDLINRIEMKVLDDNNDPDVARRTAADAAKLPPGLYDKMVNAVAVMYPLELENKAAFQKYRDLVGETQSRKVQTEYETGNYDQYPPDMPGFSPGDKQIVRYPGQYKNFTPGKQYQLVPDTPIQLTPVEHDPFEGMPIRLTPVEHDPFAMPNTSIPPQSQMPLPASPAVALDTNAYALPTVGNDKWSWGDQAPAPTPQPNVAPVNTVSY